MGDMRIEYHEVDLNEVMRHWAKDYKPPRSGGSVSFGDFWVDTSKNRAIFKLYVTEGARADG